MAWQRPEPPPGQQPLARRPVTQPEKQQRQEMPLPPEMRLLPGTPLLERLPLATPARRPEQPVWRARLASRSGSALPLARTPTGTRRVR